jgi:uncharacterized OB-fold protein
MQCLKCGAIVDKSAHFCPFCGTEVIINEQPIEDVKIKQKHKRQSYWTVLATVSTTMCGVLFSSMVLFFLGLVIFATLRCVITGNISTSTCTPYISPQLSVAIIPIISLLVVCALLALIGYKKAPEHNKFL